MEKPIAFDIFFAIMKENGQERGEDMADDNIIVKARIDEVVSSVSVHKTARDPKGEKRVLEDLKASLKAEGLELKEDDKDFQSRYRSKLRAYADYKDGVFLEKGSDGKPALMVPRKVFENELKISYSVDGKDYSSTVNYDSDEKNLKKGDALYITVSRKNPLAISRKGQEDYREAENAEQGSCAGCFVILLILCMIAFVYLLR